MTASLRRTVTVTVAALGVAFLLVWAATTGPGLVVGERQDNVQSQPTDEVTSSEPGPGSKDEVKPAERTEPRDNSALAGWVQDAAAFLVVVAGLLVVGRILHHVFARIHRGLEELVIPLDPLPDLEAARKAVERGHERQREALDGADVRNGIVECWVLFEEAAAGADVARLPAETATEFVVRFLHLLDVDPRAVGRLEHLFHEARFSTHPMAADARTRAQDALAQIHRDLAEWGVAT